VHPRPLAVVALYLIFLIQFQVRNGIGAMPAFSSAEISPDELQT